MILHRSKVLQTDGGGISLTCSALVQVRMCEGMCVSSAVPSATTFPATKKVPSNSTLRHGINIQKTLVL